MRFSGFQILFWVMAGIVMVMARAIEMPMDFARPPGIIAAIFGLLASFALPGLFAFAARTQYSIGIALLAIMAFGLGGTALSNLLAFTYLGLDPASLQWVYYFQGALRLILLFLVWAALYLYLARRFGHAYYMIGQQVAANSAGKHLKAERQRILSFIPLDDILFIQSADDYVAVRTAAHEFLRRDTLKALEHRLDPSRFARIHRSTIVNLEQISELEIQAKGDFTLILRGGQRIKGSRRYKSDLETRLAVHHA